VAGPSAISLSFKFKASIQTAKMTRLEKKPTQNQTNWRKGASILFSDSLAIYSAKEKKIKDLLL
jgi:hypothetical protein